MCIILTTYMHWHSFGVSLSYFKKGKKKTIHQSESDTKTNLYMYFRFSKQKCGAIILRSLCNSAVWLCGFQFSKKKKKKNRINLFNEFASGKTVSLYGWCNRIIINSFYMVACYAVLLQKKKKKISQL